MSFQNKYLALTIISLLFFATSQAQWTKPNNAYGVKSNGQSIDRVLFFPTGCGPDTLNLIDSAINKYAIYGDSCNNKVYFYNPKTKLWGVIGGAASNITGLISAGSNITITGTGTTEDPYVINSSGGSGTTKYILQGYGTIIDSSGDNYTINVDTTLLKDTSYVGKGIKNDASLHPGHSTLIADSIYIRDTSLNLAGGTTNQVLKKNSSTNGDWSWQDESGGTTIDTSHLSDRIDANAANIATNTTAIAGKQDALTLTTTGTSGAATLSGDTLNIPKYSGGGSSTTGVDSTNIAISANQTVFSFPYTLTSYTIQKVVTRNGVVINPADYTVNTGNITFTGFTCDSGDKIRFIGIK